MYWHQPSERESKAAAEVARRQDDMLKASAKRHRLPRVNEKMSRRKAADWLLVSALVLFLVLMFVVYLAIR